ncbi:MAG: DoxX family protein [bacterium]|nr:DoxX family protein [bacterium]
MIQLLLIFSDRTIFILRIVLALIFLAHGWPKIKNLKANAQNFNMMGFKPGALWGTVVALVEFAGALLLLLGLFTPVVSLLLASEMAVAMIWKIIKGQKLVGGYELDLILLASVLLLATLSGGLYSLDSYWHLRFF